VSTGELALSAVVVLASVVVFLAWDNKHRARADAVWVLSLLLLGAAAGATSWLTWQVVLLGVHDTPPQSRGHGLSGSILGIPVIVVPLAVLVAAVGVTELLARTAGNAPVPSPSPSSHRAAAGPSMERRSSDVRAQYPHEPPTPPRQRKIGQRVMSGSRELLGYFTRTEQRTLEAIRGEVAAGGAQARTTLADAISQIESRLSIGLEQHARVQTSTHDAVGRLQETVTDSAANVTLALEGVSEMCTKVADQIEGHRHERHLLTDAVALLARPVARPREVPPPAIVGEAEISIVDDDHDHDHRAQDPAPHTVTYERWQDRANERAAVRSSVKRLRERAQEAGRHMWTRARSNRTGSDPST